MIADVIDPADYEELDPDYFEHPAPTSNAPGSFVSWKSSAHTVTLELNVLARRTKSRSILAPTPEQWFLRVPSALLRTVLNSA
jgi:hypothetical protein